MKIGTSAHLSYCTNIHPGETWSETFDAMKKYLPLVRDMMNADWFGIGLRLSDEASVELASDASVRKEFREWMTRERLYVFTINGFPYGSFHNTRVKDDVHKPDWLTPERLTYTKRLADILVDILPVDMDGGISTSPISYRFWHDNTDEVMEKAVEPLIDLVDYLAKLEERSGKFIHIDIEPEPDGVLENTEEFIRFFNEFLLEKGTGLLQGRGHENADYLIRRHIQCCYDVCHFAVEFEDGRTVIDRLLAEGIGIGKMQISAALRALMKHGSEDIYQALSEFDEDTYLHQAVGRKGEKLIKFRDLDELIEERPELDEVRSHFHVPIFIDKYGILDSTQDDIASILKKWKAEPFTKHLEVETYTWNVLPEELAKDLPDSIARELDWVMKRII